MEIFEYGQYKYNKLETKKYGLLFEPSLVEIDNDRDSPISCPQISYHFDEDSVKTFEEIFLSVKDKSKAIIEIGVDAYFNTNLTKESSTSIILRNKKQETVYLGIDIHDKSRLNNENNNVYTVAANSADINTIKNKLDQLKIDEKSVGFIFIDGWHSVNQVLSEWWYIEKYMAKDGVAVFHDTNYHPGSSLIFEAVDKNIFKTKKHLQNSDNWGIGEIRYK